MFKTTLLPSRRAPLAATAALGLLPGTARAADGDEAIRPYRIDVAQADVDDLRRRINATRWPDREIVTDRSQAGWAGRSYHKLIYWNEVDKGGHFAAWEQPDLFAAGLRAAFRPSRPARTAG